jgi:two-component sensor histidine kinase
VPDGRALAIRQRDSFAELGACALKAESLDEVLRKACRLIADGLDVHFCKVLEYLPDEHALLVRAGVGWRDGVVGHARLAAGAGSPAGYALLTDLPVISNKLAEDTRFATPELLREHGIERAMNVIIRGDRQPFGVLEADSRRAGGFSPEDVAFVQGAANLLGVAIERSRREAELRRALEHHDLLLREADHRVKNSLQLVASLLTLQRLRLADTDAAAALDDAVARVHAVAMAHRALLQSRDLATIAIDGMLADLCAHVGQLSESVTITCAAPTGLDMDVERAIPLGLIVSELLTNAVRHAYPEGASGTVAVTVSADDGTLTIAVADAGVGAGPDAVHGRGLGTTIVNALARQIGARLETRSAAGAGTVVTLQLARRAAA